MEKDKKHLNNIRNFCIISHIDAGKSTLADRFLETTKTIPREEMRAQYLDDMSLERERGITIKLQPVRMKYQLAGEEYILNLIDTPGHVDFSYEVSRALAAVEGAVLLVDARQGIQAQTLANFYLARKQKLTLIPVINKIDLEGVDLDARREELSELLGIDPGKIICASAKDGRGVEDILQEVIRTIPSPQGKKEAPLRALIFDSFFDEYRGAVVYVRVMDGEVLPEEQLKFLGSQAKATAKEIGYFLPHLHQEQQLACGEIGYIVTGLKDIEKCRVGDTVAKKKETPRPLPGYQEPQVMVFADFYSAGDRFDAFSQALKELKLNDASLDFSFVKHPTLGPGARVGFLGPLHLEIIKERLKREYDIDLMITPSLVVYQVTTTDGQSRKIYSPQEYPPEETVDRVKEPWIAIEIIAPLSCMGQVMDLLPQYRAQYKAADYFPQKVVLHYEMPFALLLSDFYDKLKSVSKGYASYGYRFIGYRPAELVKLDILVAERMAPQLTTLVYQDKVNQSARRIVEQLKEIIPPQMFRVKIQAARGGKIIARSTVSARRKDVTAPLYGGDVSRKKKLLKKQKEGKKRLAKQGRVEIPSEAYKVLYP